MTSSEVRSILNLPQAAPSGSQPRRSAPTAKKPEGISRELYALIGDNAPSLAQAQSSLAAIKYRDRPKLKAKSAKWEWKTFSPVARQDNVPLSHWVRTSDADATSSERYFAQFNEHGPVVMEYSQFEYDQHLADPDWTPQETAYLFDLLRTYDLRFVIVADRYDYRPPHGAARPRTIEDLKDRYYSICRRLLRTRTASDPQAQQQALQSYAFDKQREIKRKQYSSELFHLTAAEIAEEEALYVEVKRMEQNEKRYRADRDDLMRTVLGLDSGLIEFDQATSEALGFTKKRKRPDEVEAPPSPAVPATKKQKESAAFDLAHGIYRVPSLPANSNASHLASKHPIHVPAHLRSTKIAMPRPTAAIRIAELLTELGINSQKLVMPTRTNLEVFDRLLLAAGGLIDMKRQVDRVEQEIRTLKAQQAGYVPPVNSRKTRSLSVASTDTSATGHLSRQ